MPPITSFENFIEKIQRLGMEEFRRYHGPYRAQVLSNQDPDGLGRVLVECPRAKFLGKNAVWVDPMWWGAGDGTGIFWPPEDSEFVFVFFDNGDPTKPMAYVGGWYARDEVPEEFDPDEEGHPKKRGFKTPGGHVILLDDTDGKEIIRIRHKDGTVVEWTDDGQVKIGKEGGSYEPLLKGSTVKQWLESHTHPHSWGPTGPPISPLPPNALSKDTETT